MKKLLPLLLSFLSLSSFAQNFKLPAYEKLTLPNGLVVYLMEQHEVPLIAVSGQFPAGSILDGSRHGLANLTAEALRFGTQSLTKSELDDQLDFVGAQLSTSGGKDRAGLSANFAVKDQDRVWPLLQEVILRPRFDATEFDKRKARLLVELKQAKDRPSQVLGEYFNAFFYGTHPYATPQAGTTETVEKLTLDDVKAFYAAQYVPNGSVIAVVGDFNTAEMKARLTRLFGGWKKGAAKTPSVAPPVPPAPAGPRVLLVNKDNANETQIIFGQAGVPVNNPDYVGIQVVNTVLGDRFTSWLIDEVRVNKGYTYGIRSAFASQQAGGTFRVQTFTPTKTTIPCIDLAMEVVGRLRTKGIDENLLTSAKNYVKGQFPPRYETPGQLAGFLTTMHVYNLGDGYINDFQKRVDALTTESVKGIIQKYFPPENFQLVLIGKAADLREPVKKYGPVVEKDIKAAGY
jgi:zinc protease